MARKKFLEDELKMCVEDSTRHSKKLTSAPRHHFEKKALEISVQELSAELDDLAPARAFASDAPNDARIHRQARPAASRLQKCCVIDVVRARERRQQTISR